MVNPQNAYKLRSADNLWILFLDQPQSHVLVFAIVNFHINIIIVKNENAE